MENLSFWDLKMTTSSWVQVINGTETTSGALISKYHCSAAQSPLIVILYHLSWVIQNTPLIAKAQWKAVTYAGRLAWYQL